MLTDPQIVARPARPYVGLRERVPMRELASVIPARIPEMSGWLAAHGLDPDGPPFFRCLVVDRDDQIELEVGIPVAASAAGDGRVEPGVLPAGRYATLIHTGHPHGLMEAHHSLQRWAAEQGLRFQRSGERWGAQLEWYLTNPAEEPRQEHWQTELAYQLAED